MTIENVMLRLGQVLAADRNLKVDVRGSVAYATKGRIVLPSVTNYAHLGDQAERMLHGILDHEAAHALFTDFDVPIDKLTPPVAALHNAIEDGRIEKAMTDRFVGSEGNLTKKNRWFWEDPKWRDAFVKEDAFSAYSRALALHLRDAITVDEVEAIRPDVATMLRSTEGDIRKARKAKSTRDALDLAKSLYERLRDGDPEPPPPEPNPECEDEEGVPPPKSKSKGKGEGKGKGGSPPPEEEPSDDEEPEDGEGGDGEKPESDDSEEGDSEGQEDDAPPEGDKGEDGDSEGEEEHAEGGDEGSDDEPGDEEESDDSEGGSEGDSSEAGEGGEAGTPGADGSPRVEPIKGLKDWKPSESNPLTPEAAVAREVAKDLKGQYNVFSDEEDFFVEEPVYAHLEPRKGDHHEKELEDAREASYVVAQAFEAALHAKRDKRLVGGFDDGEVDATLLAEFACGAVSADTLYQQPTAEDDRDVAVSILIDCSGSMGGGGKVPVARQTAYAMVLALQACGIACEVNGWTDSTGEAEPRIPKGGEEPIFYDGDSPFGAKRSVLRATRDRLRAALIESEAHGVHPDTFSRECYRMHSESKGNWKNHQMLFPVYGLLKSWDSDDLRGIRAVDGYHENLDGEALLWQARRIAKRPEPRRIIFVLSDGMPAGHRGEHPGEDFLKDCVERVVEAGIEVYGIGIQTDAVAHYYPQYWVVNNLATLIDVAMNAMTEVLLASRQEAKCVSV